MTQNTISSSQGLPFSIAAILGIECNSTTPGPHTTAGTSGTAPANPHPVQAAGLDVSSGRAGYENSVFSDMHAASTPPARSASPWNGQEAALLGNLQALDDAFGHWHPVIREVIRCTGQGVRGAQTPGERERATAEVARLIGLAHAQRDLATQAQAATALSEPAIPAVHEWMKHSPYFRVTHHVVEPPRGVEAHFPDPLNSSQVLNASRRLVDASSLGLSGPQIVAPVVQSYRPLPGLQARCQAILTAMEGSFRAHPEHRLALGCATPHGASEPAVFLVRLEDSGQICWFDKLGATVRQADAMTDAALSSLLQAKLRHAASGYRISLKTAADRPF